jgi:NCS1 family nucleobase:cation symporter-1
MGVWITLPGFAQRVRDPSVELEGWSHMYYFSWPLGTLLSMATYWALCRLRPMEGFGITDDEDVFGTFGPRPIVDGVEKEEQGSDINVEKGKADVSVTF